MKPDQTQTKKRVILSSSVSKLVGVKCIPSIKLKVQECFYYSGPPLYCACGVGYSLFEMQALPPNQNPESSQEGKILQKGEVKKAGKLACSFRNASREGFC